MLKIIMLALYCAVPTSFRYFPTYISVMVCDDIHNNELTSVGMRMRSVLYHSSFVVMRQSCDSSSTSRIATAASSRPIFSAASTHSDFGCLLSLQLECLVKRSNVEGALKKVLERLIGPVEPTTLSEWLSATVIGS